jgi:hypothetical protein
VIVTTRPQADTGARPGVSPVIVPACTALLVASFLLGRGSDIGRLPSDLRSLAGTLVAEPVVAVDGTRFWRRPRPGARDRRGVVRRRRAAVTAASVAHGPCSPAAAVPECTALGASATALVWFGLGAVFSRRIKTRRQRSVSTDSCIVDTVHKSACKSGCCQPSRIGYLDWLARGRSDA